MKKEYFEKVRDGLKKCPTALRVDDCEKCPYSDLGAICSERLLKDAGEVITELVKDFKITDAYFS